MGFSEERLPQDEETAEVGVAACKPRNTDCQQTPTTRRGRKDPPHRF